MPYPLRFLQRVGYRAKLDRAPPPTHHCHLDPEQRRRATLLRRSGETPVLAVVFAVALALLFSIPAGNLLLLLLLPLPLPLLVLAEAHPPVPSSF